MSEEYVTQIEGAYRVVGTRVLLDGVVYSYRFDKSPDSIQRSFPTLTIAQVHGAIAYYLDHDKEIDRYLIEGEREFEKLKRASRKAYPGRTNGILDSNTSARNETCARTYAWYEKLERNRKEIVALSVGKTCFLADANLNQNIVSGVLRQVPEIDFPTAHEASPHAPIHSEVLHLAADMGRILVTQDQRTTPKHFEDFMPLRNSLGVLIVSQESNIEPTIDELILIWKAFDSWEHVGLLLYL